MELNSFLGSDAALLLFSGLGLIATGLAIVRDIPVQRRVAEQPVSVKNETAPFVGGSAGRA